MKRIHIVGCPRSGTTLLMELMATCFRTHRLGKHEVSMFDLLPVTAAPAPDLVFLSKNPTDVLYAHTLLDIDPDLHILYIVRDPRAVVSSVHWSYDGYFTNYRVWRQCEARAQQLSQHARFHQVRYEDLVAHPNLCQQRLQARLPFLAQLHQFSEFAAVAKLDARLDILAEKAMNGLRPVDTGSLTKWHQHLARVKSQLQRHPGMQADLQRLDYERDDRWQHKLTAVPLAPHRCRASERKNLLKLAEKNLRVWLKAKRYQQHLAGINQLRAAAAPVQQSALMEVD